MSEKFHACCPECSYDFIVEVTFKVEDNTILLDHADTMQCPQCKAPLYFAIVPDIVTNTKHYKYADFVFISGVTKIVMNIENPQDEIGWVFEVVNENDREYEICAPAVSGYSQWIAKEGLVELTEDEACMIYETEFGALDGCCIKDMVEDKYRDMLAKANKGTVQGGIQS